jgi:hypothetical protein
MSIQVINVSNSKWAKEPRTDLTAAQVRAVFNYHPETGNLIWRRRPNTSRFNRTFNTLYAGKVAGTKTADGYISVRVNDVRYLAHRIAWLWVHGEWPSVQLDHINGDEGDNRLINLREADFDEQARNRAGRAASGRKGVSRSKSGRYTVRLWDGSKNLYLGSWDDLEAADDVARKAREHLHGDFANHEVR